MQEYWKQLVGKKKQNRITLNRMLLEQGKFDLLWSIYSAILENLRNEVHKLPSNEAKFLFERDKSLLKRARGSFFTLANVWRYIGSEI